MSSPDRDSNHGAAPRREELIDEVDVATGEVIATLPRRQVHAEGRWHQVFHCLVVRPSERTLVLQERSPTKAAFPGKLDLSVTGHLDAGEQPVDGIREAEEELGVTVDAEQLVPLGVRLLADDNGEGRNRERVHVYFLADDRPLSAYRPPADEVSALVEIEIGHFLATLADSSHISPCRRLDADSQKATAATMRRDDLVEGTSGYWVMLGVMAERFLDGDRPLAI